MSHRAAPRHPRTSCRRRLFAAGRADRILAALGKDDIKFAQALFRAAPKSQRDKILARIPERYRDVFHPRKLDHFKLSGLPTPKGAERRRQRLEGKPTVTFLRTYKYRLYPTRGQSQQPEAWCAAACAVFNAAISETASKDTRARSTGTRSIAERAGQALQALGALAIHASSARTAG